MSLRIVVPVDGSLPSEHAFAWAVDFARRTGAIVSACSVVDPRVACMPIAGGASIDPGPMLETLEEGAGAFCAAAVASAAAQNIPATTAVLHGTPAEAIDAFTCEGAADLIVLGTNARRGLARGIFGSVTAAVVQSSRVPVLAIRAETVFADRGPIIVAIDDSEPSAAAARFALRIACALALPLHLVHVGADNEHLRAPNAGHSSAQQLAPTASQVALGTIAGEAAAAGVACSAEIRYGDTVEALIAAVAERGGSILATGTHGRGAVGRLFLGSVAEGLVRGSTVPVLIVRNAA